MPFDVSFDAEMRIVTVRVYGSATREDHYAALRQSQQLCAQHGCRGVLVDLRELDASGVTTLGCFSFGESMATSKESRGIRFANVLPEEVQSARNINFVSTVASNRGALTQEFTTIEDAKTWLLQDSEP